jgi:predicted nucleic acid-binding protein
MKALVLDCSATLPWVFGSEATKATDALLETVVQGAQVWVPALWHLEIANVLIGAQKRGRIDQAGITQFLTALEAFDIRTDDQTTTRAWHQTLALAERYQLTSYDAAYLELSLRRNLPLATLDKALTKALKKAGGRTAL